MTEEQKNNASKRRKADYEAKRQLMLKHPDEYSMLFKQAAGEDIGFDPENIRKESMSQSLRNKLSTSKKVYWMVVKQILLEQKERFEELTLKYTKELDAKA